jgi:putative membrane protein
MHRSRREDDRDLWKGALAGMLGGLAGAVTMMVFQMAWSKAAEAAGARDLAGKTHRHEEAQQDATAKVASIAMQRVTGVPLRGEKRKLGGSAVHFGFGAAMGAFYGALAELTPATTTGYGTAFGAGLFAGADELALPRLGLSKDPENIPAAMHGFGLASHAVYGATVEGVRRAVRGRL